VPAKVALVELGANPATALTQALRLIGGIADLNTAERSVVVKVGIFDPASGQRTTSGVVQAIADSFSRAPHVYVAESDNYKGPATRRLQVYADVFSQRLVPLSLSEDAEARQVRIAGERVELSHLLFKPNVLVSTHVFRRFDWGMVLKNLLGLVSSRQKVRFHKKMVTTLLDLFEAVGGIDLAVIDGTYLFVSPTVKEGKRAGFLLVGRDAIAVETMGTALAGLDPTQLPLIQEAVQRGLGEGDLANIQVVGRSLEWQKAALQPLLAGVTEPSHI
jgi:uncharacterized protein (DUF362 family)